MTGSRPLLGEGRRPVPGRLADRRPRRPHLIRASALALLALAVSLVAGEAPAAPAAAGPATHWYRIAVADGAHDGASTYDGSSSLALAAMTALLAESKPIRLDNLIFYKDHGAAVAWSDEEPEVRGSIVIHPARVVSIMPLTGDPRRVRGAPATAPSTAPASAPEDGRERM